MVRNPPILVRSVAGRTGDVAIAQSDVSGLVTALGTFMVKVGSTTLNNLAVFNSDGSVYDVGIAADDLVYNSSLGTAAGYNVGTTNGTIALLGSGGKFASSVMPAVTLGETFSVASQAAMLALTAQQGDVAIRTDLASRKFMLINTDPATLGNWVEIGAAGNVASVNGQTGVVVLAAGDVGAPNVTLGTASGLSMAAGQVLSLALATTSAAGAMSAADKTRVNTARVIKDVWRVVTSGTSATRTVSFASGELAADDLVVVTATGLGVNVSYDTNQIYITDVGGLYSDMGSPGSFPFVGRISFYSDPASAAYQMAIIETFVNYYAEVHNERPHVAHTGAWSFQLNIDTPGSDTINVIITVEIIRGGGL